MDERNRPGAELRRGYESQWELMGDLFSWLDLRLYFFCLLFFLFFVIRCRRPECQQKDHNY